MFKTKKFCKQETFSFYQFFFPFAFGKRIIAIESKTNTKGQRPFWENI